MSTARVASLASLGTSGLVVVPPTSDVWRYLDGLAAGLSASELQRLAAGWRVLLHLHDADAGGECARCTSGYRGPCTVWQVATGYLTRRSP